MQATYSNQYASTVSMFVISTFRDYQFQYNCLNISALVLSNQDEIAWLARRLFLPPFLSQFAIAQLALG